jgi:hypothetical protein
VHGTVGAGKSFRREVRLGAGPHRLNVDPDRGQGVAVEVGEQARSGA